MPLDEIAGSAIGAIARFIGYLFVEIVFEFMVKGPGYIIVKYAVYGGRKDVSPDSGLVLFIGVLFWVILIAGGIFIFT